MDVRELDEKHSNAIEIGKKAIDALSVSEEKPNDDCQEEELDNGFPEEKTVEKPNDDCLNAKPSDAAPGLEAPIDALPGSVEKQEVLVTGSDKVPNVDSPGPSDKPTPGQEGKERDEIEDLGSTDGTLQQRPDLSPTNKVAMGENVDARMDEVNDSKTTAAPLDPGPSGTSIGKQLPRRGKQLPRLRDQLGNVSDCSSTATEEVDLSDHNSESDSSPVSVMKADSGDKGESNPMPPILTQTWYLRTGIKAKSNQSLH